MFAVDLLTHILEFMRHKRPNGHLTVILHLVVFNYDVHIHMLLVLPAMLTLLLFHNLFLSLLFEGQDVVKSFVHLTLVVHCVSHRARRAHSLGLVVLPLLKDLLELLVPAHAEALLVVEVWLDTVREGAMPFRRELNRRSALAVGRPLFLEVRRRLNPVQVAGLLLFQSIPAYGRSTLGQLLNDSFISLFVQYVIHNFYYNYI